MDERIGSAHAHTEVSDTDDVDFATTLEASAPQISLLPDLDLEQLDLIAQAVPGGRANIQEIYPLAPLQEGILFHHILKESGDAYLVPLLLEFQSEPHLTAFVGALRAVIARHDILRTSILWERLPQPVQVVYRQARLAVEEFQWNSHDDLVQQLTESMRSGAERLDLRTAPLLRLKGATDKQSGKWYGLLLIHHIICDAKSLDLIRAEITAHLNGRSNELPEPVQYRVHVARTLAQTKKHDANAFFRSYLGDIDEPTAPFSLLDVHGDGSRLEECRQALGSALAARLRTQARRRRVSVATLFHTAWGLIVAHATGRSDIVYGTVLFGRLQISGGAQQSAGLFLNTLPLRLRLQNVTVAQAVLQTQRELFGLLNYEQAPLAVTQRCSGISGYAPLFTSLLDYRYDQRTPDSAWTNPDHGIRLIAYEVRSNYPLSLLVDDDQKEFLLTVQADERIDCRRIMGYVQTAMTSLTDALERAPETPILALGILPESERRQLIDEFNGAPFSFSQDLPIHRLFEEQAQRSPDAIAVQDGVRFLTYCELNRMANRLARQLQLLGVGPTRLVAVCIERSVEMVLGVMAVLKAGGAYIPLDPDYPSERITYMLANAAPCVVLTQNALVTSLPIGDTPVFTLEKANSDLLPPSDSNLDDSTSGLTSEDLAYVIYTSGSTGEPKGVMVSHRNLLSSTVARREMYGDPGRFMLVSSLSFDSSVAGLFGTLCYGGTLLIPTRDQVIDPEELVESIYRLEVNILLCVPTLYQRLLSVENFKKVEHSLSRVIVAGEPCTPALVAESGRVAPSVVVFNEYGPTETTVWATAFECRDAQGLQTIPIGKPIANARIYILDGRYNPVPIGVEGEIYIGGAGVARGYLNRPDLTSERFLSDPFSQHETSRMYRTGDLGRWLDDGNIEYRGRNDQQVKIRGYRIELGEIEAQLMREERVRDAVVVVREDSPGEKHLVAYIVKHGDQIPVAEDLRKWLETTLPEFMIPTAFVVLEKLPLTPSGKLDRRALPLPELSAYAVKMYEAPMGEREESLAATWRDLLRVQQVGRRDNFFQLGGHSLQIVQMLERLRRIGLTTDVRSVFESTSLAALAQTLRSDVTHAFVVPPNLIPPGCEAITPAMLSLIDLESEHIDQIVGAVPGGAGNVQDIYPLAPLQEGLLFHHLVSDTGGDTYVIPMLLHVISRAKLADLIVALQGMVDRHDILRTAVVWEKLPQPVQVVYRHAALPVVELTLDENRDALQQLNECMRPEHQRIDLRLAPLIRLQVAANPRGEDWYALLQLHGLVCDHESLEIVFSELICALEGHGDALPKPTPYRNYVSQALEHARLHDAETFFRGKLAGINEPTAPFGLLDVFRDGTEIDEDRRRVESDLAHRLRSRARRMNVSPATLFHAAWGLVVSRTSCRTDIVFGTVLLGRLQVTVGAQRILGMFINTLPLRLQLQGVGVTEFIEQTQREVVSLLQHEQAPLATAQRCSDVEGSAPLFTTLFNYRHTGPNPEAAWEATAGIRMVACQDRTNYPITLSVDDLGDGFSLYAQTDQRIEAKRLTEYLHTTLLSLVEALENNPARHVLDLEVLPEHERQHMLEGFNPERSAYAQDKLIHQLFEEQVGRTPDSPAVRFEAQTLTYSDLNTQANRLARHLRANGIVTESRVALLVERSLDMIVGLLGILKAGGTYIPLDPKYPVERLAYMLDDAAPAVILTQEHLKSSLPETGALVISLDTHWNEVAKHAPENLDPAALGCKSGNLAYVIYTSGSTGEPKGVMIEHTSVVNFLSSLQSNLAIEASDRVLALTTLSFDIAALEIYLPLMNGAQIVLVGRETASDPQELISALDASAVTVIQATPTTWQMLLGAGWKGSTGLVALCGGEALTAETSRQLRGKVARLWNLYGPTETTIWSCRSIVSATSASPQGIEAIGSPLANTRVYVLDAQRQIVPAGVVGEIYIGGTGLARGYLNRPMLTQERFVADPFSNDSAARMYRTGDLGRWRVDGTIDYVGRNDQQVKVRGYRIELGEIEAALLSHRAVDQAVVLARTDEAETHLVAYVSSSANRLKALDAERADAPVSGLVDEWKSIYDVAYAPDVSITGPSFAGWNSLYTGLPIPQEQMQEWLDWTVARIQALAPRRVLEIGCGIGSLLERIAPTCRAYSATDLSAVAVEKLRRWLTTQPQLHHVNVSQTAASDMDAIPIGSIDTVILNSVIQYFPDVEYFVLVLHRALERIAPGGQIYIGDVRNLELLELLHSAVELFKAGAGTNVREWRLRTRRGIEQEKELAIAPRFFYLLAEHNTRISHVEIQLKRGRRSNELSKYRYDVILHVDKPAAAAPFKLEIPYEGSGSLDRVAAQMRARLTPVLRLTKVPNQRLAQDIAELQVLSTSEPHQSAAGLRDALRGERVLGEDPETFWNMADEHGYRAVSSWTDGSNQGHFDVEFVDKSLGCFGAAIEHNSDNAQTLDNDWSLYATDPLAASLRRQLVPQLRQSLQTWLPDYMVPNVFMILETLPLTPNGKIDRRALPSPEAGVHSTRRYQAPQGAVEETLARVWQDVLSVERVGRNDNFFELGGHSLLGIKLIVRIADSLSVQLPVASIFECPTLQEMAQRVVKQISESARAGATVDRRINQRSPEARVPMTYSQQSWLHQYELDRRPSNRSIFSALRLTGRLKIDCLADSVSELVRRHEALRVRIDTIDGVHHMLVDEDRQPGLKVIDLTVDEEQEYESTALRIAERVVREPIRITTDPLFVARLIKMGDEDHVLILAMDHLISDIASMSTVQRDLWALYAQIVQGRPPTLPRVSVQFADYAVWQKADRAWADEHAAYWRDRLAGANALHPLNSTVTTSGAGRQITTFPFSFNEALTAGLRDLGRREKTTLALTVLSAYVLLLSKYGQELDLVVPLVTSGRLQPEVDNTVGFFASMLFVRVEILEQDSLLDVLRRVAKEYRIAYVHHDSGRIAAQLPRPPFTRNPVFNWFPREFGVRASALGALPDGLAIKSGDETISTQTFNVQTVMREDIGGGADGGVMLSDSEDGINGMVLYRPDCVARDVVERFSRNFLFLAACLVTEPTMRVTSVALQT